MVLLRNDLTLARMADYAHGVNDNFPSFSAMKRRIAFLIYADFQLLDAAGPIAAFETAERFNPGSYSLQVIAAQPGLIASSSGVSFNALPLGRASETNTLIIAGGSGTAAAAACPATRRFIVRCAKLSHRVASVCSGTYVLAAAGILDGKNATTHWSRSTDFAQRFPKVRLDSDRIFIKDGKIWSSAGVTAGIDLSLAMIAEDLGESAARRVAQHLVVYYRRPGGQSQFSALLEMEQTEGRFSALLDYIRSNLEQRLNVTDLASRCCVSPRHFARRFHSEVGTSPAKAVERLRVETARAALESGAQSNQSIAKSCGFGNAERMRRSFLRTLGTAPSTLKRERVGQR